MKEETKENIQFIVIVAALMTSATGITHMATDWSWKRQIAGHHCAEFYIDQSNYRQWRWLDCNKK